MSRITKGLMSSDTMHWRTPEALFNLLDQEFNFDCDVCASDGVEMVPKHYTPEIDGLAQDWSQNKSNWMNPPYGTQIKAWMKKAAEEIGANIVCLVPARTDTDWWHSYVMNKALEVRFIKGRLKFTGAKSGTAPFPSAIVIYRAGCRDAYTVMSTQERE